MEKQKKASRKQMSWKPWACLGICLVLYLILTWTGLGETTIQNGNALPRNLCGQGQQSYQVFVDGLGSEEKKFVIDVEEQKHTRQQAMELFDQVMEGMEERIRGENPSLEEIRKDLVLPVRIDELGLRLEWDSEFPELVGNMGEVDAEQAAFQGSPVYLKVHMTDGIYHANYEIRTQVLPPIYTAEEQLEKRFREHLKKLDQKQSTEAVFVLPEEFEGFRLRYRTEKEGNYRGLISLGVVLAVLCQAKEKSDDKSSRKKKERQMLLDYPEIVSKLMIFISAGMTVRVAWERIVNDYEELVKAEKIKRRYAYEEMARTCHEIQSGVSEGKAFEGFGRRCRLPPYLKLSGLLEQNRRSGTKDIRVLMREEMRDAFEQRKNQARKLGEEAGTKLLIPLFMMLGIVMVMVMVPAMMSIG